MSGRELPIKGQRSRSSVFNGRGAASGPRPAGSSPFALLAIALICFGTYPLFLRTPDETPVPLGEQKRAPCPTACNYCSKHQEEDGEQAAVPGAAGAGRMPGSVTEDGAEAAAHLQGEQAHEAPALKETDRATEGAAEALRSGSMGGGGSRGSVTDRDEEQTLRQEKGPSRPQGQALPTAASRPEERSPPPGASRGTNRKGAHEAEAEDDGDMEEAEAEALRKEKEAEAPGPKCRCKGGAPLDCNEDLLHHRAVASVCSIAEDIRDMWHYHKWHLSRRLNRTSVDEQLRGIVSSVGFGGAGMVGDKLIKNRTFRAKVMRKLRDPYGRRNKLPRPFDVFNDALADPEEFDDRDQEDAYLSVLATRVLGAVRGSMHDQEFMRPDKIFYSLENHETLREKHDYFRNGTLKFLPAESPALRYGSCAVVGNSGGLLDEKSGVDIDAHDLVIRTNQAPSFHYEEFVGNRTGMRILNKKWTNNLGRRHMDLLNHDSKDVITISSRANVRQFTLFATALQRSHPNAMPLFLSTHVVTGAMRFLRLFRTGISSGMPHPPRGGNTATRGFLGVFLATHFCEKVSVYGFSLEECRSDGCSADYHYFKGITDSPFLVAHPSHSFELEGLVLRAMHALGMACLYPFPVVTGECGSRLNGLVGEDGVWQGSSGGKLLDLYEAIGRLGLSNSTGIKAEIEEFKSQHEAERAAMEAAAAAAVEAEENSQAEVGEGGGGGADAEDG